MGDVPVAPSNIHHTLRTILGLDFQEKKYLIKTARVILTHNNLTGLNQVQRRKNS